MTKILIAEDERDIRDLIVFTLQFGGYEVVATTNGAEAADLAPSEKPDLIMLDVRMPKMTGYEACIAIKANPITKNTPVIFLSAKGQESEVNTGLSAGAYAYILKPFAPDQLITKVKEALSKKEVHEAPATPSPAPQPAEPAESGPVPAEAKPAPAEPKPAAAESKPAPAGAKPAEAEPKPVPAAKPAAAESKPAPAGAKPAAAESKPAPADAKPATGDTKPGSEPPKGQKEASKVAAPSSTPTNQQAQTPDKQAEAKKQRDGKPVEKAEHAR